MKNNSLKQKYKLLNVDSVKIHYVSFVGPSNAVFTLQENKLEFKGFYFHNKYKGSIKKNHLLYFKFLSYINTFYIKKTEKIILKKQKINYIIDQDFPSIRVISYKKGKEIFNKETSIGEPQYKIKFNPKFLEFYHFLDSLVREPFRQ